MRVLVFAERVHRDPWAQESACVSVCRGLARRGHEVTLACESCDRAWDIKDLRVVPMRSYVSNRPRYALGLPAHLRRVRRDTPHDATLSLTTRARGDVLLPMSQSPLSFLAHTRASAGALAVGKSMVKEHSALIAAACEWFGSHARSGSTMRLNPIPFSTLCPIREEERRARRDAIRRALAIPERRVVGVLWAGASPGGLLRGVLGGLASIVRRDLDTAPCLGVLGRYPIALQRECARAGLVWGGAGLLPASLCARVLGTTSRMDDLLCAADFAVSPVAPPGGADGEGRCGRFLADALVRGLGVLVRRGAPGSATIKRDEHLRKAVFMVEDDRVSSWSAAISRACDRDWRERAGASALHAGASMGIEPVLERLESALAERAGTRAVPGPAPG